MSEMMSESDYAVVSDPQTGMRLRMILVPHGGRDGTGSVDVADYANGTLISQAIEAWLSNNVLEGSGVSIDRSVPGQLTITATAGGGSYTDEQVLDLIGSSMRGTTGRILVTPDDTGNTTTVDVDPVLYGRITALETARSLVQSKETVASGGGANYMNFPTGANYVDTPSKSAFNNNGDFAWYLRVQMPASAPAADWCIYSRRGSSAATSQFSMFIQPDGQMHATTSINGTTNVPSTTTAATPLVFDGNWIWMRIVREQVTGQWSFYTAPDTGSDLVLPTAWTTFQLNRGNSAGPLWNNAGALAQAFEVNGFNGGSSTNPSQIGRVLWYAGLNTTGTLLADANAADYVSGTTWTGPAGNVWTLHGTATVVLVGGGATSGTNAKFVLGDTDPFATIPLAHRDTGYWTSIGGLLNSSGGPVNFTPEIVVGGVILSTYSAISLPSATGVYRYEFQLTVEISASDGASQVYSWSMKIWNAVAGTFAGSQVSSTVFTEVGGDYAGPAIGVITTVPKIELKMTMGGTPGPTIAAGSSNNRLSLQKA